MSENVTARPRVRGGPWWFTVLVVLDAFVLGGLVTTRMIVALLEDMGPRFTSGDAQSTVWHIVDQLVPYWFFYGLALVILLIITLFAFAWIEMKRR